MASKVTFTLVPNKVLTVVTDTEIIPIPVSHPNWDKVVEALNRNDEAEILRLMDIKQAVKDFGSNLSYTGEIRIEGNQVFYRNEKLFGRDVDNLLYFMENKIPADGLFRFLERKLNNVSFKSIESLYPFLNHGNMPLTPDGTFIGYKGVKADFSSKNSGNEPLIKGKRLPDGTIDNSIGEEIRMDRRYVSDDINCCCGAGLHIGTLDYAKMWAGPEGKVVLVEADPADVVIVPTDSEKLRVCAYTVKREHVRPLNDVFTNEFSVSVNDTVHNDACWSCGHDNCSCDNCDTCSDCERTIENCECDSSDSSTSTDGNQSNRERAEGYTLGVNHGKSHKARLYKVGDENNLRRKSPSPSYIRGYNDGYRDARATK